MRTMTTIVTRRTYCDVCKNVTNERESMEITIHDIPDSIGGRTVRTYHVCNKCQIKVNTLLIGDGNKVEY